MAAVALLSLGTLGAGCTASTQRATPPRQRLVVAPAVAPARVVRPPNILVITADDMRADDLRWMPRTRRLIGGTGLQFRNSFAPNPLCCPSRASFLSGEYSHNHRVLTNEKPYGFHAFDDSQTIATALRHAGYRTALVGKYLNGYGSERTHAGHHPSLHYIPPGWSQWYVSTEHRWPAGEGPGGGTYHYFHLTENVNGEIRSYPGRYTTDVTSAQTRDLVQRFGAAATPKPWFIWWTPLAPHVGLPDEPDDPGTIRSPSGHLVVWGTPARPTWVKHRFDSAITHGAGTPPGHPAERDVSDKPHYLRFAPPLSKREKGAERSLTRQRAEALYILDRRIADTLRTIRDTGQARRTIVVFTSDNGYYLGEHRKRQGKTTLHEPSIRVPLLMTGPHIPHGLRYDPATGVDLPVTIAGWASASLPNADGTDLRRTIARGDTGWRRPIVLEGLMDEYRYRHGTHWAAVMRGLDTVGIRTGRWKFVRYSTGEWELYDLRDDPLELHSLRGLRTPEIQTALERAWRSYAVCSGTACRMPLPRILQTGPRQTRRIARHQERERQRYFRY
ncbi:MAG TPA: sulfatase-like hydrolase/transferase [Nocardioides sp.]|uniref:sulfatase-like hydrolase/transferase n=1 Tax=Nocardioides sp. TaxID=35761 RepID=UPI002F42B0A8